MCLHELPDRGYLISIEYGSELLRNVSKKWGALADWDGEIGPLIRAFPFD